MLCSFLTVRLCNVSAQRQWLPYLSYVFPVCVVPFVFISVLSLRVWLCFLLASGCKKSVGFISLPHLESGVRRLSGNMTRTNNWTNLPIAFSSDRSEAFTGNFQGFLCDEGDDCIIQEVMRQNSAAAAAPAASRHIQHLAAAVDSLFYHNMEDSLVPKYWDQLKPLRIKACQDSWVRNPSDPALLHRYSNYPKPDVPVWNHIFKLLQLYFDTKVKLVVLHQRPITAIYQNPRNITTRHMQLCCTDNELRRACSFGTLPTLWPMATSVLLKKLSYRAWCLCGVWWCLCFKVIGTAMSA